MSNVALAQSPEIKARVAAALGPQDHWVTEPAIGIGEHRVLALYFDENLAARCPGSA